MIKRYLFVILLFACNDSNVAVDTKAPKKETSPYTFSIPTGWGTERIVFPIEFAPQITYKGVEELRFAPGWGLVKSDEYWSYSFLWWLDGTPAIDEQVLQENTKVYYTGLVGRNVAPRSIPPSKVIPVTTSFKKLDTETYSGTITMTDYMDILFKPITLNCLVHKTKCNGHTAVIFGISPKPLEHAVWQPLNKLQADFTCEKNQ